MTSKTGSLLSALWGCTVKEINVQPDFSRVTIHCRLEEKGHVSSHILELLGIDRLTFGRGTPYCHGTIAS